MSYQDKTLTCKDCGVSFVFTAGEQEFYEEKGFTNEPSRCPRCRANRKNSRRSNNKLNGEREMYTARCAACGRETTVPFKPSGTKPVYCRECFKARKNAY